MDKARKSELKQAYKETPVRSGVIAIRCESTEKTWVDSVRNVDTIRNRIWFTLGLGTHPNQELQASWNQAGENGMEFEILEVFADDTPDYAIENLMKERKKHWMAELGADSY